MRFRSTLILAVVGSTALLAAACGEDSDVSPLQPAAPRAAAPAPTVVRGPAISPGLPLAPATPQPALAVPTSTPTPVPEAVYPITVADSNGRKITFDNAPERIVAFDSAVVEILFAIGEWDRIVATHSFAAFPPEVANIPRVGGAFDMDVEAVVALEPDLVYVFFPSFIDALEAAGLKVLYIETLSSDFTRIAETIHLWGGIVGKPAVAAEVAADFTARIEKVGQVMESVTVGPSILNVLPGFWTMGNDTLEGEVFDLLKLNNIAGDISGYAQISAEEIVAQDPDYIFTDDPQEVFDIAAFRGVSAVKSGQVLTLVGDPLSVSGPRFVEGIEFIAKLIYPELF